MDDLVYCLIDFQLNNAECFFIDKATERGDAVASSIDDNTADGNSGKSLCEM